MADRIEHLAEGGREMLAALKAIQPEMRREHDSGDGHFSTAQLEAVEAAIAITETAIDRPAPAKQEVLGI